MGVRRGGHGIGHRVGDEAAANASNSEGIPYCSLSPSLSHRCGTVVISTGFKRVPGLSAHGSGQQETESRTNTRSRKSTFCDVGDP